MSEPERSPGRAAAVIALGLALVGSTAGAAPEPARSETVVVPSGTLKLRGSLWRPEGSGPYPAVLFVHGSTSSAGAAGERDQKNRLREPAILGPTFASRGSVYQHVRR